MAIPHRMTIPDDARPPVVEVMEAWNDALEKTTALLCNENFDLTTNEIEYLTDTPLSAASAILAPLIENENPAEKAHAVASVIQRFADYLTHYVGACRAHDEGQREKRH